MRFNFFAKLSGWAVAGVLALSLSQQESAAQIRGEDPTVEIDSNVVFEPARPLIDLSGAESRRGFWGANVTFSDNGFGGGVFFQKNFTDNLSGQISLEANAARKTDELELGYDPISNRMFVPGKVNRLFMFPMMFSAAYRVFAEDLTENFRPYVAAGLGPTFIFSTPYNREFFSAFKYTQGYVRPGAYVGIGANVGTGKNLYGVSVKYYTIPFGGSGLESIGGSPIKDFGGLFLGLSISWK